ncbi:bifunctional diguanylate cyclase/phosphodiesterase [Alkalilimnicola ehrlichii]|uniref:putative bifunctional diguanylate cyclase/phosphodiesterase n=1 Tax=Alkalilimnicola ehrlichii TaxID=351052 RepID=UPI0021625873|nr:GGDEF domain-containing phosphodiesterase [Alkalilimnicola ehrlichii]
MQEAVLVTDGNGTILRVNPAFSRTTGFGLDELSPKSWRHLLDTTYTDRETLREVLRARKGNQYWRGELWCRRKDQASFPALVSLSTYHDPLISEARYIIVFSDISHYKQAQAKLAFLSKHDPLTGLSNRDQFRFVLSHRLDTGNPSNLWIYCIGLDRFKSINSSLGDDAGDQILQQVGKRLLTLVGVEHLARLGNDEFAVLTEALEDAEEQASHFAMQLQSILAEPYEIDGRPLFLTAGVGVAHYPDDGAQADDLLQAAQAAMAQAKQSGRQGLKFFSAELTQEARSHIDMIGHLRGARERGEFTLFYQPRLADGSDQLAVEALIRWQSPELGWVSPGEFIPLAEDTGLIGDIGRWVLHEACRQGAYWNDHSLPVRISINLSVEQLRHADIVDDVCQALEASALPPELLELEITETMMAADPEAIITLLRALKNLGVSLAVDDFGTGYSSMNYLKRFPLDYLKIDRSFIEGIPADPDDCAIIRAIVALAQGLKVRTVAEGVETPDQLAYLRALGVDEIQGFLIARPAPADDTETFLRSREPQAHSN